MAEKEKGPIKKFLESEEGKLVVGAALIVGALALIF